MLCDLIIFWQNHSKIPKLTAGQRLTSDGKVIELGTKRHRRARSLSRRLSKLL